MKLEDEKKLVEASRSDPRQFGVLFDMYYQQIFNYVLKRVADVALAQDIASSVFYKAYKKLWQFRWRGVSFVAWLYRIAHNEINNHYRSNSSRLVSLDDLREEYGFEVSDGTDIEQELIRAEEKLARRRKFLSATREIAKLDVKYQEVLALRYYEHKKIREIGEILGKKQGTVKSLVSRGLAQLRARMVGEEKVEIVDNVHEEKSSFRIPLGAQKVVI